MSKKTKIIFLIYFISLFIFELIIGVVGGFEKTIQYCAEKGNANPLIVYVSMTETGVYHFIVVSIIAIACIFYKKLDKSYKIIIYFFLMFTFFLYSYVDASCKVL